MLVKDIWKVSSIFSDTKFWTKETDIFLCVCIIKSRENLENFESVDFNKFHANVKVKNWNQMGGFSFFTQPAFTFSKLTIEIVE